MSRLCPKTNLTFWVQTIKECANTIRGDIIKESEPNLHGIISCSLTKTNSQNLDRPPVDVIVFAVSQ